MFMLVSYYQWLRSYIAQRAFASLHVCVPGRQKQKKSRKMSATQGTQSANNAAAPEKLSVKNVSGKKYYLYHNLHTIIHTT